MKRWVVEPIHAGCRNRSLNVAVDDTRRPAFIPEKGFVAVKAKEQRVNRKTKN
jgi:hypothetical protein